MGSGKQGSENPYKTLVGQLSSILEMVMSGKRKLADVTKLLQVIIAREDFITVLDVSRMEGSPRKVKRAILAKKGANNLLKAVGTVEVPATTESFRVSDRFTVNLTAAAPVKIVQVDAIFTSWFGKMLVDARPESTCACHQLTRNAYDRDILSALGGEAKCKTNPAEIWQLMLRQGHGESGALLADGWANIFYVRDSSSALRAVSVYWSGSGWSVVAIVLDYSLWSHGRRVFVRNS